MGGVSEVRVGGVSSGSGGHGGVDCSEDVK